MKENTTTEDYPKLSEIEPADSFSANTDTHCAVITAESEASEEAVDNYNQPPTAASQTSFMSRALRFAFSKILPGLFMVFSLAVAFTIAISFVGQLEINTTTLVRLMLGDIAGGLDYVAKADKNSTSMQQPIAHLSNDVLSDTAAQNSPPNESGGNIMDLSNETPYSPDMNEILCLPRRIPTIDEIYRNYGNDAPIVLIIHTHTTESFADTAADGYRSFDEEENIIAIGQVIADKLQSEGINTIHCAEIFDSPDFGMAYYNASQAIRSYMNEYPSISYVLDIHRDSIELEDGTSYAPTSITPIGRAAQIMFVIGTDHGGSDHTQWRDNLALAARLQDAVSDEYPTLMRNINLRSASFNEQYTKGSLLIEVGASASTLDEAKLGAEILAEYLAREIIG